MLWVQRTWVLFGLGMRRTWLLPESQMKNVALVSVLPGPTVARNEQRILSTSFLRRCFWRTSSQNMRTLVYWMLGIQLLNSKRPWGMLGKSSGDLHPSLIWEPKLYSDIGILCVLTIAVICGHPDFTSPLLLTAQRAEQRGNERRGGEMSMFK